MRLYLKIKLCGEPAFWVKTNEMVWFEAEHLIVAEHRLVARQMLTVLEYGYSNSNGYLFFKSMFVNNYQLNEDDVLVTNYDVSCEVYITPTMINERNLEDVNKAPWAKHWLKKQGWMHRFWAWMSSYTSHYFKERGVIDGTPNIPKDNVGKPGSTNVQPGFGAGTG